MNCDLRDRCDNLTGAGHGAPEDCQLPALHDECAVVGNARSAALKERLTRRTALGPDDELLAADETVKAPVLSITPAVAALS